MHHRISRADRLALPIERRDKSWMKELMNSGIYRISSKYFLKFEDPEDQEGGINPKI